MEKGTKLTSEQMALASPMSFHGAAARIWRLHHASESQWARAGLVALALTLIALAWIVIAAWYVLWGLLFVVFVPYRLVRRGQRKRRMEAARHREVLERVGPSGGA